MFYPVIIVIGVVLLGIGVAQRQFHTTTPKEEEVSSPSPTPSPSDQPTPSPLPSITHIPSPKPTTHPTIQPSPTPTQQVQTNSTIDAFLFPDAKIIEQTTSSLHLTSTVAPEDITSWYKQQIERHNMNITTFVTTSANDSVLNKLAGAGKELNVMIVIERKQTDQITSITVTKEAPSSTVEVNVHNQVTN